MKNIENPEKLVNVPFNKTRCGVDFYINTGDCSEIRGVLTENTTFKTDFFEFFLFRRASGTLILGTGSVALHDNMVLIVSPHQQQRWIVDEDSLDYSFLIFREDFMRTFIADKFFVYRLLYCYQTDTPPFINVSAASLTEYSRLLGKIKTELQNPTADSYDLIVSILYYLLTIINREYAAAYKLPVAIPKNNYAYRFKALLEQHFRDVRLVSEYADMMHISRITLNRAVMSQFGVTANHLIKQRLVEALKNDLLFGGCSVSQLAEDYGFSDPSHLMRFFKQQTGKTFSRFAADYCLGVHE